MRSWRQLAFISPRPRAAGAASGLARAPADTRRPADKSRPAAAPLVDSDGADLSAPETWLPRWSFAVCAYAEARRMLAVEREKLQRELKEEREGAHEALAPARREQILREEHDEREDEAEDTPEKPQEEWQHEEEFTAEKLQEDVEEPRALPIVF